MQQLPVTPFFPLEICKELLEDGSWRRKDSLLIEEKMCLLKKRFYWGEKVDFPGIPKLLLSL